MSKHDGAFGRGLCWACYFTPGVRGNYPSARESKFARRGILDFYGGYRDPEAATEALPGTAEKVAVLEARASAGVALWHEGDAVR